MIKSELIQKLCDRYSGLRLGEAERVVEVMLGSIGKALADGHRVELRGFGSFLVKQRKARKGRNPRTGEMIEIKAKRLLSFRASRMLRRDLNSD